MNDILQKKIFKIGKKVLDELTLHNNDIEIEMIKNIMSDDISNNYTIIINSHSVCHISNDNLKYIKEYRND